MSPRTRWAAPIPPLFRVHSVLSPYTYAVRPQTIIWPSGAQYSPPHTPSKSIDQQISKKINLRIDLQATHHVDINSVHMLVRNKLNPSVSNVSLSINILRRLLVDLDPCPYVKKVSYRYECLQWTRITAFVLVKSVFSGMVSYVKIGILKRFCKLKSHEVVRRFEDTCGKLGEKHGVMC